MYNSFDSQLSEVDTIIIPIFMDEQSEKKKI
jgi:hypothetical protein